MKLVVFATNDDDNMRNKIKRFQLEKIPYTLIVGDRETVNNTFSVRSRKDGDLVAMDIKSLCDYLTPQIEQGNPKCIIEDEFNSTTCTRKKRRFSKRNCRFFSYIY